MVKRDHVIETSLGSVRDTDSNQIPPVGDLQDEDPGERPEGYYRPEMGNVVVHEYHEPLDEA